MSIESKIYKNNHITDEVKAFIQNVKKSHEEDYSLLAKFNSLNFVSRFMELNSQISELEINKTKFHSGRATEIKRGLDYVVDYFSLIDKYDAQFQVDQLIVTKMVRLQEEKKTLMINVCIAVATVVLAAGLFSGVLSGVVPCLSWWALITFINTFHDFSENALKRQENNVLDNLEQCLSWDTLDPNNVTAFHPSSGAITYMKNKQNYIS